MSPALRRLLAALLLVLGLPAVALSACQRTEIPTPEPPVPSPAPEPSPVNSQGAGSLGQVVLSVPNVAGATISWTASSFVDVTSAVPSQFHTGDQFAIYGSATGLEASAYAAGFVASATVNAAGGVIWTTAPTTWPSWPFVGAIREAGSSVGLSIYINGNLGASGSGGHMTVDQGNPNAGGALSWFVQGPGTAGAPFGGVLSVQGVSGGTTLPTQDTASGAVLGLQPVNALQLGGWNGANFLAFTPGQKTMASSFPVVIASDQSTIPVTSTSATATSVHSTGGAEATHLLSASSILFYNLTGQILAATGTGTYYLMLVQPVAGACPVDGAVTTLELTFEAQHTAGATTIVQMNDTGSPLRLSSGACAVWSTTGGSTKTQTAAGTFGASIQ